MADESTQWDDVRKEEAAAIEKSRNARMPLEHKEAELVGLAISGGGIRSATFGLGVLEGLREKDLLRRVDYLSTVSGGGYIGGWLSTGRFEPIQTTHSGFAGQTQRCIGAHMGRQRRSDASYGRTAAVPDANLQSREKGASKEAVGASDHSGLSG